MFTKLKKIFVIIPLILSLVGCQSDVSASDTLVYGSNDFDRINPAIDEHGEINVLLFDGLLDHDSNNELIGRLAKSWSFDQRTNSYTFELEKGVKWHDGKDFTAKDVKFTIEAIQDSKNESENAPNYEDVKAINVLEDYKIQFVLKEPNVAFLEYMTIAILPEHLLKGKNMQEDAFFKHPIGTGPYKFVSWDKGQQVVLEKNDEYFSGAANIKNIIFKIVSDDNVKALQLKSNELSLAQITPKDAKQFDDNYQVYDMKTSDYRGILYNFNNQYWKDNKDLIPAISYCIDKNAILDSILLGKGEVAYSPLQRNIYNNEKVNHYDYDLNKADALFKKAGCTRDEEGYYQRNGKRVSFTINATPSDQVRIDMAKLAAQQLNEAGIEAKANVPTDGIDWDNQECCIIGWGSPFDADDHTYKVFGTNKGANYSAYSSKEVDKYLKLARETSDTKLRKKYYALFQEAFSKDPAYTFFTYIDAIYVAQNNVKGIDSNVVLGHHGVGIFYNICDWTLE